MKEKIKNHANILQNRCLCVKIVKMEIVYGADELYLQDFWL